MQVAQSIVRCCLPSHGRSVDDRRVLDGIFWVLRSGAPSGPSSDLWSSHHFYRFVPWRRAGIRDSILQALARAHDRALRMIDPSMMRIHQQAACIADRGGQAVARSRGGLARKLHVVVEARVSRHDWASPWRSSRQPPLPCGCDGRPFAARVVRASRMVAQEVWTACNVFPCPRHCAATR